METNSATHLNIIVLILLFSYTGLGFIFGMLIPNIVLDIPPKSNKKYNNNLYYNIIHTIYSNIHSTLDIVLYKLYEQLKFLASKHFLNFTVPLFCMASCTYHTLFTEKLQ